MDTVIFGGTFNPLHIGHLYLTEELLLKYKIKRILFVPSNIPAHKNVDLNIKAEERYIMLKKALEKYRNFIVEDCEIKRGGISYTIETVEYLKNKYNIQGKPGLVIGDDLIEGFSSWKDADELVKKVNLIVFHRSSKRQIEFSYPHEYIENTIIDISSTKIRNLVSSGADYRHLVPEEIYNYIKKNELYK